MATRGAPFETGPSACPFVALELDRDRRSERPDYRHRCYAEQVPAPRTIAHQERYCLSPNFSGCPIFQEWAVRAAARPVPLPPGYEGRRAAPDPRPDREAAAAAAAAAGAVGGASETEWPDSMDVAAPAPLADEPATAQQLSAFDAPATPAEPTPTPAPDASVDDYAPVDERESGHDAAGIAAGAAAATAFLSTLPADAEPADAEPADASAALRAPAPAPNPPPPTAGGTDIEEAAPVPEFLAARSSRPAPPPDSTRPAREEVVPSWELSDRYGAQAGGEPRDNTFFRQVMTAIAVVFILGLGIAAVIVIPGLLNGSPGSTPRPSFAAGSVSPTAQSSAVVAVPTPTRAPIATPSAVPTTEATPAPTPRLYKIRSGDTMAKISRKFKVAVADILAANPQIPDANHIEVGQYIVIPVAIPTT